MWYGCGVASAPAPHGMRIISPLTLTLVFSELSGRLQKKNGPEFFLHLSTVASVFVLAHPPWFLPPLLEEEDPRLKFAYFYGFSFTSLLEFARL